MSDCIEITEIRTKGHMIKLSKPLYVTVDIIDDLIVLENKELGMVEAGISLEACILEFKLYFVSLWKAYALESDDKLTKDAIEFKKKLRAMEMI